MPSTTIVASCRRPHDTVQWNERLSEKEIPHETDCTDSCYVPAPRW